MSSSDLGAQVVLDWTLLVGGLQLVSSKKVVELECCPIARRSHRGTSDKWHYTVGHL